MGLYEIFSGTLQWCLEKGLGVNDLLSLGEAGSTVGRKGDLVVLLYCNCSSVSMSDLTVICVKWVLSASRMFPFVKTIFFPFQTALLIAKRLAKGRGLMWTLSHYFYLNFWTLESLTNTFNILTFNACLY